MPTTGAVIDDAPTTLVALLDASVAAHAERPALGFRRQSQWRWMRYDALRRQVLACAHALRGLGVEPGDRVALITENAPEWPIVAYACYRLGAVVVPTFAQQAPEQWRHVLTDSGAKVAIVAGEQIVEAVAGARRPEGLAHVVSLTKTSHQVPLFDDLIASARPVALPEAPGPDDLASILYTSGTTGDPRGVMLTHANLTSNVRAVAARFDLGPEDVGLSFLPWAHSLGQLADLHVMLYRGAAIAIADEHDVDAFWSQLQSVQPTVMVGVPSLFARAYDEVREQLQSGPAWKRLLLRESMSLSRASRALHEQGHSSVLLDGARQGLERLSLGRLRERFGGRLRFAISGGAALSEEIAQWMTDLGIPVYQGYGLTETAPVISVNAPGHERPGSAGRPLPDVHVRVIAEDGQPLGPLDVGELVVRGPNLMRGYWQQPEATAAAMITLDDGDYLCTGDLGRLDEDGFLYITGRRRALFKLATGRFINPVDVEARLNLHPLVTQSFVTGLNQPHPVALIVPDRAIVTAWAKDHGVSGSWVELIAEPRLHRAFGDLITEACADLKAYEVPRRWSLLLEPFSPANGLLTPTGKLVRHKIEAQYGHLIESLG